MDGHLSTCVEGTRSWRATRDSSGRITAIFDGYNDNNVIYDPAGRVVSIGAIALRYDHFGWLTEVAGEPIEHDAAGRITREGAGSDAWTYDYTDERLSKLTTKRSTASLHYDERGRLKRIRALGPISTDTVYEYDCN